MKDYNQAYISNTIKFFEQGFKDRWQLKDYEDTQAPAVFVGIYNSEDISRVNNHKGDKILVFTGADINNYRLFKNENCISDQYTFKHKLIIPIKSYELFKPIPLGEKIYVYMSTNSDGFKAKFRMDIVERLQDHFKDDILIGYHGNTIEEMISNYYSKSFINLQLNKDAGFTTALEMAHMGRRSISNYEAPFCVNYKNLDMVVNLINQQKKYIGKAIDLKINDYICNSDKWLTNNFWK